MPKDPDSKSIALAVRQFFPQSLPSPKGIALHNSCNRLHLKKVALEYRRNSPHVHELRPRRILVLLFESYIRKTVAHLQLAPK
jgi:hypothetical protein